MKRQLLAWTVSSLATFAAMSVGAGAANYPDRPVKVIVSAAAGNGPDVIGRIIADHLTRLWGQQVLITNHPGAGGAIAVRAAGKSAPDGYTLYLAIAGNFVGLSEIQTRLPFDIVGDFVPIGLVSEQPMLIGTNSALGVRSLPELIALAKKRQGEINIGVGAAGGLPHLTAAWLRKASGTDMTIVHYPGAPQAVTDLIGGRVHVTIEALSVFKGAIASGSLKPLAVAAERRLPNMPDLPTAAETLPGFVAMGWFALMAPPGTPQTIARKVSDDLRSVLGHPELKERFVELGSYAHPTSPGELIEFIRSQQQLWGPVLAEVGLTMPK
jgi:tripartite-type tricarboxylate transporter receptor subunit TctC